MISTVLVAWLSGRYKQRSPFIIISYGSSAIGFIALLAIPHPMLPGLTYGFLFLAASGLYAPLICLISWIANNLAPSSKRAVGMVSLPYCRKAVPILVIIFSSLHRPMVHANCELRRLSSSHLETSVASSDPTFTWPRRHPTIGQGTASLAVLVVAIMTTIILRFLYARINKQREAMDRVAIEQQYTLQELLDMGDKAPTFRYSL